MDIMPTILDLAGIQHPAAKCKGREMAPYRDRQVFRMTGKSWVNYFTGSAEQKGEQGIYGNDFWFGWELHGMASLRKGQWKIVFMGKNQPTGKGEWELFDLDKDPGEIDDLAQKMPDKLKEMMALFDQYVENTGTVWGPVAVSKKPFGWELPDDSVGGNPQKQRDRWPVDPTLKGEKLQGKLELPAGF